MNGTFNEQLGGVAGVFEQWGACEQTVLACTLARRVPWPGLKLVQRAVEAALRSHVEDERLERDANDELLLAGLLTVRDDDDDGCERLHRLLGLLPLLRVDSQRCKELYVAAAPALVQRCVDAPRRSAVVPELCRQLLCYLLVHPALTHHDQGILKQWLIYLENYIAGNRTENVWKPRIDPCLMPDSNIWGTNSTFRRTIGKNVEFRGILDSVEHYSTDILQESFSKNGRDVDISIEGEKLNFDATIAQPKSQRSNSLTPPSSNFMQMSSSAENLSDEPFVQKPRSFSLSSEHSLSQLRPISIMYGTTGSETRLDDLRSHNFGKHPGMSNVAQWLKSLRLHKYEWLFTNMSYEQMMTMDEKCLEELGVTKGARHKLLLSIKKLSERGAALEGAEAELRAGLPARALQRLRHVLLSPMPPASDLPAAIVRALHLGTYSCVYVMCCSACATCCSAPCRPPPTCPPPSCGRCTWVRTAVCMSCAAAPAPRAAQPHAARLRPARRHRAGAAPGYVQLCVCHVLQRLRHVLLSPMPPASDLPAAIVRALHLGTYSCVYVMCCSACATCCSAPCRPPPTCPPPSCGRCTWVRTAVCMSCAAAPAPRAAQPHAARLRPARRHRAGAAPGYVQLCVCHVLQRLRHVLLSPMPPASDLPAAIVRALHLGTYSCVYVMCCSACATCCSAPCRPPPTCPPPSCGRCTWVRTAVCMSCAAAPAPRAAQPHAARLRPARRHRAGAAPGYVQLCVCHVLQRLRHVLLSPMPPASDLPAAIVRALHLGTYSCVYVMCCSACATCCSAPCRPPPTCPPPSCGRCTWVRTAVCMSCAAAPAPRAAQPHAARLRPARRHRAGAAPGYVQLCVCHVLQRLRHVLLSPMPPASDLPAAIVRALHLGTYSCVYVMCCSACATCCSAPCRPPPTCPPPSCGRCTWVRTAVCMSCAAAPAPRAAQPHAARLRPARRHRAGAAPGVEVPEQRAGAAHARDVTALRRRPRAARRPHVSALLARREGAAPRGVHPARAAGDAEGLAAPSAAATVLPPRVRHAAQQALSQEQMARRTTARPQAPRPRVERGGRAARQVALLPAARAPARAAAARLLLARRAVPADDRAGHQLTAAARRSAPPLGGAAGDSHGAGHGRRRRTLGHIVMLLLSKVYVRTISYEILSLSDWDRGGRDPDTSS
ncbi:uncharacterized protein LOC124636260 isoform X2 [Helicoverpa zea]|uniref:uncharacterized protein LOC124636260 isoform X2 n=1 Tax=Helicoverpa zea TaxID=7113 RepID=UPI001F5727A0|nr:uncharacterized protein LOC124636260 isoform X2 [Helicoverpa zea]